MIYLDDDYQQTNSNDEEITTQNIHHIHRHIESSIAKYTVRWGTLRTIPMSRHRTLPD